MNGRLRRPCSTHGRARSGHKPAYRPSSNRASALLKSLFVEVFVPPAVVREAAPSLPDLPSWIVARELSQPTASDILRASLGRGESEVFGLASEVKAAVVILDGRPARRLARGLFVVGRRGSTQGRTPQLVPLCVHPWTLLWRPGFVSHQRSATPCSRTLGNTGHRTF